MLLNRNSSFFLPNLSFNDWRRDKRWSRSRSSLCCSDSCEFFTESLFFISKTFFSLFSSFVQDERVSCLLSVSRTIFVKSSELSVSRVSRCVLLSVCVLLLVKVLYCQLFQHIFFICIIFNVSFLFIILDPRYRYYPCVSFFESLKSLPVMFFNLDAPFNQGC